MERISIQTFIGDYRSVDGMWASFKTRIIAMGQERSLILESIQNNIGVPAERFDPPEEVRAWVEKTVMPGIQVIIDY